MKNERRKYMNNSKQDILNNLIKEPFINQRILAAQTGHSLGIVNRSLKELISEGYLDEEIRPTEKALREAKEKAPKNAIILAAGFGMRMVPINTETPKGLLEIKGERLIECTIRQLHEVGITEIYIVVGFMKEQYEYLIDEYGVDLIVAPDYTSKNNLHSLKTAADHLSNSYIIPCDIWCEKNPYSRNELYSWYMVSDLVDDDSTVRVNRKQELVVQKEQAGGNAMIGICYLLEAEAAIVRERLEELGRDSRYDGAFWEETLYRKDRMIVTARVVHAADAVEINTYEQLREIDSDSSQLQTDAIQVICEALGAQQDEVTNITVLKKGMTNRSFLFSCKDKKYIMRIPGEGTDQLINRRQEAAVYQTIAGRRICDEIAYINPENGYKITDRLNTCKLHFHGNASFFFSFVYKIYRLPKHTVCRPYAPLNVWQFPFFEKFRQFVRVFYFYVVLRFCKIIGQSFSPVCLRWENKLSFGCFFFQTAARAKHDKSGCTCQMIDFGNRSCCQSRTNWRQIETNRFSLIWQSPNRYISIACSYFCNLSAWKFFKHVFIYYF